MNWKVFFTVLFGIPATMAALIGIMMGLFWVAAVTHPLVPIVLLLAAIAAVIGAEHV